MDENLTSSPALANKMLAEVLVREHFLIVDNAPTLSQDLGIQLRQIFEINELDFNDFKYDYVLATSEKAVQKIIEHKNIIVSTSFTTIKTNAVEDLMNAGIKLGLKNKNIFSLMQFSNVGEDFEYYKPEVSELAKNNIRFWFMNKDFTGFDLYE